MASIKVEWATLTGLSTDDARTSFMDVIAEWPYYQHQIFDVKVGGRGTPHHHCLPISPLLALFVSVARAHDP